MDIAHTQHPPTPFEICHIASKVATQHTYLVDIQGVRCSLLLSFTFRQRFFTQELILSNTGYPGGSDVGSGGEQVKH